MVSNLNHIATSEATAENGRPKEAEGPYPDLVRTSSLNPQFVKQNPGILSSTVTLQFEEDVESMTENWTPTEIQHQRRLVKFEFERKSKSNFNVKFHPIKESEFTPDVPIISCILWKEKDLHVVTSVDIILVLEFLVKESFSIEEKNRIRRNLQSLKPFTISRLNSENQRFFNLLMGMEDPRPRNIEKDLKVFKWSDLSSAIHKVISKYSVSFKPSSQNLNGGTTRQSNTPASSIPSIQEFLNGPVSKDISLGGKHPFDSAAEQPTLISNPNSIEPPPKHHQLAQQHTGQYSSHSSFLPFERLKVMKKKLLNTSTTINDRGKYQHALKPSDPVPLEEAVLEEHNHNTANKHVKGDVNTKNANGSSTSNDEAGNEADVEGESEDLSPSSQDEPNGNQEIGDSVPEMSKKASFDGAIVNGDHEEDPKSELATSRGKTTASSGSGTNIFSNETNSRYSSLTSSSGNSVGTFIRHGKNSKHIPSKGRAKSDNKLYYQYPDASQLIHSEAAPLSTKNIKQHNLDNQIGHANNDKNLPSIQDNIVNIDKLEKRSEGVQLPPILQIMSVSPTKK